MNKLDKLEGNKCCESVYVPNRDQRSVLSEWPLILSTKPIYKLEKKLNFQDV